MTTWNLPPLRSVDAAAGARSRGLGFARWRGLLRLLPRWTWLGYRPEKHYMRGPRAGV